MDLFNNITNDEKIKLLANITIIKHHYLKGEALYLEDSLCNSIALIKKGKINAIKYFSDGHSKIIRSLGVNECIGINLIFSTNPYYKASFYAIDEVIVEVISKDDLFKLMYSSKTILINILNTISDSSILLNDHIKLLSYKTIKEKLCYFFYTCYEKNHNLRFTTRLNKTELAEFLNVERPSLSTELSKLINENIIENNNKEYIIKDLDKLKSYL